MQVPKDNKQVHDRYHEAERRSKQSQPVVRHSAPMSLLLLAPNNIIFELFNTVLQETQVETLVDYIRRDLRSYLELNWTNKTTQRMIGRLRREQKIDARAGLIDVPLIGRQLAQSSLSLSARPSSSQTGLPSGHQHSNSGSIKNSCKSTIANTLDKQTLLDQIHRHLLWRINSNQVTQVTSLLIKLAIEDGYKRGKLKAPAYDEVGTCFEDWRSTKLIKLYSFGNAPANDQRLLLANSSVGDLSKWVANFIDGTDKRQSPDLIRKLASALRDKTKNCIYLTHDLDDALGALATGALRCALVLDRSGQKFPQLASSVDCETIKQLITNGKMYFIASLDCVEFAPDPTSPVCC